MPIVSTTFEIRVQAVPSPTYAWYIGDEEDPEDRTPLENDGLYSGVTTRILTINDVTSDLSGNKYSCKVTNSKDSTWSDLAELTVLYRPVFTTQPEGGNYTVGQDLILSVEITPGVPAETTYAWYKGETLLEDGGRISGATTDTITITPYEDGDAGSYTCVISNTAGSRTSDAAVITTTGDDPELESYWTSTGGFTFS